FKDTPLPKELPEGWSFDRYNPWDTLAPLHDNWNLLPQVVANEHEIVGSVSHYGTDALETQRYSLSATYGSATRAFGGTAIYINDAYEPTFALFGDADAVSYPLNFFGPDGTLVKTIDYDERRWSGGITISVPVRQRHRISMGYTFESRTALRSLREQ